MIKRDITPTCESVQKLNISGNVTPATWYTTIRSKNTRSSEPHLLAISILSDIVYWYRPTEVRDENTGHLIGYKKKFAADLLQRNYDQVALFFGVSYKVSREACKFLEELGILKLVFRNINTSQGTLQNVCFMDLDIEVLKAFTYPSNDLVYDMSQKLDSPKGKEAVAQMVNNRLPNSVIGVIPIRKEALSELGNIYKENNKDFKTKNTTEKEKKEKKLFSPSPTFEKTETSKQDIKTLDASTIQDQKEKSSAQKEKENTEWFTRQSELESKLAALDFSEITTPQTAVPFQNVNGKKIYQTPDEMAQDLKLYWQGSPSHKDALNFVLSELGIITDAQKIAWAKFMKAKVYPSILTSKTYKEELMDVVELHKVVVYKYLTFDEIKEQIKALKVAQVTKKEVNPQALSKKDFEIILFYCNETFKLDESDSMFYAQSENYAHRRVFDRMKNSIVTLREEYQKKFTNA